MIDGTGLIEPLNEARRSYGTGFVLQKWLGVIQAINLFLGDGWELTQINSDRLTLSVRPTAVTFEFVAFMALRRCADEDLRVVLPSHMLAKDY